MNINITDRVELYIDRNQRYYEGTRDIVRHNPSLTLSELSDKIESFITTELNLDDSENPLIYLLKDLLGYIEWEVITFNIIDELK